MGQIKNIKLHIVTDIKKNPSLCIQYSSQQVTTILHPSFDVYKLKQSSTTPNSEISDYRLSLSGARFEGENSKFQYFVATYDSWINTSMNWHSHSNSLHKKEKI